MIAFFNNDRLFQYRLIPVLWFSFIGKNNIFEMEKIKSIEYNLTFAVGMVLLSIFLMMVIIPVVYTKSLPDVHNTGAVIGISLAIMIRLLIFLRYRSLIKRMKQGVLIRKSNYLVIGILLLFFGLIYSDGAFAFLDNDRIPYVSVLMFSSVFCDFIAAVFTFVAHYKARKLI